MKKSAITFLIFFLAVCFSAYSQSAYKSGEYFKFQVSYGIVNAGVATLELKESTYDGKKVYHAKGIGKTTGLSRFFFKVNDDYQSYFDKSTGQPYRFIRKINEGGYTRNQEGFVNYKNNTVLLKDHKNNTEHTYNVHAEIQDVISSFYYLRNHKKLDRMKAGETIEIDMFFDDEIYKFKLKFMGYEKIKTKFGTVNTMKFRPYVQAGRIFKEQESLTMWISDDKNRVPLKVEASLLVGSLKAELIEYKNLRNKLEILK
ncbi:MAG TPA: DUF3108 domain-containing protein [Flavobacterium sp.]|nr:DUF3108 domain-containing protein [Flavobacterium sp.]